MESPKRKIQNSFGNSAKNNGYKKKELSRDDKKQISNKLSKTSQSVEFQNYQMKKKENSYATVLNREEFRKLFLKGWSEVFMKWNWGSYEEQMNNRYEQVLQKKVIED